MGSRIRVSYSGLEDTACRLDNESKKILATYQDMLTTVESLVSDGYMEGSAAQAYIDEFKQLLDPDMRALADLIAAYSRQLRQVSENVREADMQLAKMLF